MLEAYSRIIDRICVLIKYFVAIIISLAILVSFIEVVRRYLFNKVFAGSDEFIRYCIVYVGLVGGAAAYRYGQLVIFDSVINKLGFKGKSPCGIISDLISLALLVPCFVLSVKTVMSKSVLGALSTGMKIPMVVPYMAFVAGFFLMILFCIESLLKRTQTLKCGETGAEV